MTRVTRVVVLLLLCVMLGGLGGCISYIRPSDAVLIDDHAGNVHAINPLIQADPAVPGYLKRWMAAEDDTWQWLSAWGHGKHPTATTRPAVQP
jgi:hypothetical protein